MLVEYLGDHNLHKYDEYLDGDFAENIGREFYRGIVVVDNGTAGAALIWELIHLYDENKPTVSRIAWGKVTDTEMGEFLMKSYSLIIAKDNVERSFFELDIDFDPEILKLFGKFGFNITTAKTDRIELRLSEVEEARSVGKMHVPYYIKSLEYLSTSDFKTAIKDCISSINRELVSDLFLLDIRWYEQDVSCYVESDDKCSGFLLVHRCTSGRLRIELLADWGKEPSKNLMAMIRYSLSKALESYPEDTVVYIILRDNAASELVSYFFPRMSVSMGIRGDRTEM